ncbi:sulfotransferase family protein [Gracilimonas amylolytica]|uniref:sulfotransferase family protein n=1 Tax=Gracilimonas amylolytica TaxID=1749045 RepID=UPI000CD9B9A0|nr:sulfotransferase [Gracilimonas amylolytica]
MKKIFIVGCPRSGTTLLQSFLASHSDVVSFPETHLYSKTISINPLVQALSWYRTKHLNMVERILTELEVPINKEIKEFGHTFSTATWVQFLNLQLDHIGEYFRSKNETYLLEKTPRHLHFIDLIQSAEPDAQFIHIIRKGEDVVASMVEATKSNPNEWSGNRSVDTSIFWWNRSIRLSEKFIGRPNNYHIRYEDLTEKPEKILRYLFKKMGIPFEEQILTEYHRTADSLIGDDEVWKNKNTESNLSTSNKFEALPDKTREHIQNKLIRFDHRKIDINNLS